MEQEDGLVNHVLSLTGENSTPGSKSHLLPLAHSLLPSCHQAQLLSRLWNEQKQSCILELGHKEQSYKFLEIKVALIF